MMFLAYFPPLWRLVMDRRLLDFYGGDISRANLAPVVQRRVMKERKEAVS
jgi:alkane 1-monooxygenase